MNLAILTDESVGSKPEFPTGRRSVRRGADRMMQGRHDADAIVIGGGHNGLVAAAYLARAGFRPLVLEARDTTGGASSTHTPWGPEYKVTSLSYVVSLLPPQLVNDLELERHGYRVHPMGPGYIPFPDGRSLTHYDEIERTIPEYAKFSRKDAEALPRWEAYMSGLADVLSPLLMSTPPSLGSRRPRDLLEQLRLAWGVRGFDVRTVAELTRLFTMSISDVLDGWFESDQVKTDLAINGIIGTWAGPEEPGTAYVMVHHSIGEVGDGGKLGSWGYPEGGMGAVATAIRKSAEARGAMVHTGSPVERILTTNGRVTGVALRDGTEYRAPVVVAATHPRITFLQHLDRGELPADFVNDIERWRSRSGVVKVNVALSELPDFIADPGTEPQEHHGGAIELCHSMRYLEQAFLDARGGEPAQRPYSDGCIPSVFDKTLCPEGTHVMSLFTQWVPSEWAKEPHREELEAYADRVIDGYTELAPNFKQAVMHREVIGPYDMEHDYGLIGGNIFHGELTPDQLFHMRPAPGYADFTTPVAGLYQCSSATHGGGGVTGIPGYLAAQRIVADRKRAERSSRFAFSKARR
jgi:phytoene dehydrogenase-like protein